MTPFPEISYFILFYTWEPSVKGDNFLLSYLWLGQLEKFSKTEQTSLVAKSMFLSIHLF